MSGVRVPFPRPMVPVTIIGRVNRFTVAAEREGQRLALHLPNSGRMPELLAEGTPGLAHLGPGGRTAGRLYAARHGGRWVSVDARMPNRLFAAALEAGALPEFAGLSIRRREVPWGAGRMDFLLGPSAGRGAEAGTLALVETKSCNLVEDGVALFPDAPTLRGARHLAELQAAGAQGYRAAVVWFVQRDDAGVLRPHPTADPAFARALAAAVDGGVEVYAYRCRVTPGAIRVLDRIALEPA